MAQRMYINVNGEYGLTSSGKKGWATAKELLTEMDRLGIWQTVLEFTGACNSLYRAKTMLKDIAALDCPRERVIPCFTVEPGLIFQTGALDEMVQIMENNRPFCVSLRPIACGKFPLKAIEEVFERISHLNPVVMISVNQVVCKDKGSDDLVWLAERFPNFCFVIREFYYSDMSFIYNTLRRAKNIYMDMSMDQSMHAIEIACEHFGGHRVLFGQSLYPNGGASMGAIEYAEISEETKEMIRCRNFINLFADQKDRDYLTRNLRAIEDKVANSFWRPFVEGKGVTQAELYDSHCHLGYTSSDGYVRNLTYESQIAQYEEDAARFNIKMFVNSAIGTRDPIAQHAESEAAVLPKKDMFRGYVIYNPNMEELYTDEYLAERFATGYYVGLKSLPIYVKTDIDDKRYERMFQYAHDHRLVILLHTETIRATPMRCAEMAARYPDCKVILGHSGMFDEGRAECEVIAQDPKYSNVYFEICGSFLCNKKWAESLPYIDYRRILYGTDAPIHSVVWELGKLLSEDIPDEQLTAILGENARELFGF